MNCPTCRAMVKKLTPQEGDIILLRVDNVPPPEQVWAFGDTLKADGVRGYLLVVDDMSELYILDERAMAHYGWQRIRPGIAWGERDP